MLLNIYLLFFKISAGIHEYS